MISFLIGFAMQFFFALARTINVKYISEKAFLGSVASGVIVSAMWIVTTSSGINMMDHFNWTGIAGYLSGAAAGVALSMYGLPAFMKSLKEVFLFVRCSLHRVKIGYCGAINDSMVMIIEYRSDMYKITASMTDIGFDKTKSSETIQNRFRIELYFLYIYRNGTAERFRVNQG